MAQKVAVITDSIACLTRELVEQYGIRIVPINLYFGDKAYRDWVDITPAEAYELFLKDPDSFKTSGSNPREWLEACREASARDRQHSLYYSLLQAERESMMASWKLKSTSRMKSSQTFHRGGGFSDGYCRRGLCCPGGGAGGRGRARAWLRWLKPLRR